MVNKKLASFTVWSSAFPNFSAHKIPNVQKCLQTLFATKININKHIVYS